MNMVSVGRSAANHTGRVLLDAGAGVDRLDAPAPFPVLARPLRALSRTLMISMGADGSW
jgi:hypothetical protein